MKKILILPILLIISFAQISFANNSNDAQNFTQNFVDDIFKIVKEKKSNQVVANKLADYLDQNIDISTISKFILGRTWRRINEQQKEDFFKLLRKYVLVSYAPKFNGYSGEKYKVLSTKEIANNKYVSIITITTINNVNIELELLIIRKDFKYKLVDLIAEGISFAGAKREEFAGIISNNGFTKFLKILEKKIEELEKIHK